MKILGIETSCDETAVCIVKAQGAKEHPSFNVLGNALYSQIKIHAEHGGVFPMLAKREHAKNLVPLLTKVLKDADMYHSGDQKMDLDKIKLILNREEGLFEQIIELLKNIKKPDIDLITVTSGPGLEPALWVGISFAQALSEAWDIPVIAANHMEGHIISPLISPSTSETSGLPPLNLRGGSEGEIFPALALLISGGHTELVLVEDWGKYNVIGKTRDDAVGEAFDKVARILDLPYPGGPRISRLAAEARAENSESEFTLPRPMIHSKDFDFSFSGIKTAVLYMVKKFEGVGLSESQKKSIALEFEDAVTEVLISKTRKAFEDCEIKTLIIGGGVIANTYIRESFTKLVQEFPGVQLLIPDIDMATDNAIMIAAAGYINFLGGKTASKNIIAEGNLAL